MIRRKWIEEEEEEEEQSLPFEEGSTVEQAASFVEKMTLQLQSIFRNMYFTNVVQ